MQLPTVSRETTTNDKKQISFCSEFKKKKKCRNDLSRRSSKDHASGESNLHLRIFDSLQPYVESVTALEPPLWQAENNNR